MSYSFSFALVDKYYFRTEKSNTLSVTPEMIETFLKESSCFLASAGFGRDHYVLAYFRMIRDEILLKNSLGAAFVDSYYRHSPSLAYKILKSSSLSWAVRMISYGIYFLLNYSLPLVILFFILLVFRLKSLNRILK